MVHPRVDFSVVDEGLNPTSHGKKFQNGALVDAYSMANHVVEIFEFVLTGIFTLECVLKLVALGVKGKGSYWKDSWNVVDFFMLFASFVAEIPGMPNISEFRAVRVLRPLRSLSAFPGMRRLITALLNAIPALQSVVALQMFAFLIFGILGIQLFGGRMGHVCRLTEFPVRMPATAANSWPVSDAYLERVVANASAFRCLEAPLLDFSDATFDYGKDTSPWRTPQDCFWPLDYSVRQLCAEPSHPGGYRCRAGSTCGSNYDAFGNPRFRHSKAMQEALHTAKLNWGFTTYDHIGRALLTIFQSVTEEGWTLIMYMTMDASHPVVGACFAIALIIFASHFVMNLTIAVISEEFKADKPERRRPARRKSSLTIYFSDVTMVFVFANTVMLSLDHYPMARSMESNLELAHFVFLCVFVLELLLKLAGLGWRQYFYDRFNVFDAVVVVSDVIEVIALQQSFSASDVGFDASGARSISLLRAFRLVRVFRLARRWKSLRDLLRMIAKAVASIGNFGGLLFLFLYIFALMGMQFFANTMRFDEHGQNVNEFWNGTVPRSNFDTLPWSIATVFQVVTGDNWSAIMYDAVRGNGMFASLYFILLVVLGDFVLMSLFLALLLDNFATRSESSASEGANKKPMQLTKRRSKISPIEANKQRIIRRKVVARTGASDVHWQTPRDDRLNTSREDLSSISSQRQLSEAQLQRHSPNRASAMQLFQPDDALGSSRSLDGLHSHEKMGPPTLPEEASSRVFGRRSKIRQWAAQLSTHPTFHAVMFAFIAASSIVLALENPLHDPESLLARVLLTLDKVFAVVFLFEMAVKVVSLGLVLNEGAYLRDPWNAIDAFVAVSSTVALFARVSTTNGSIKALLSLRDLRSLRPLRMISRRPGLKLVVSALVESIPAVLNVVFLSMILFLLFSIAAVNFLKGTFRACSGDVFNALSAEQKALLVSPAPWDALSDVQRSWFSGSVCEGFRTEDLTSQYVCECWGATWKPVLSKNFDNVGSAMLTFFILSTSENWSEIMKAACDATRPGMQPIANNNELWIVFFIVFMVVGSFFVMNVFVGVIIDNFNTMKAKLGGDFLLTPEQKKWMEAQKSATRIGPIRILKPPPLSVRRLCFTVVRTHYFEGFIMSCILVNTLLMGAHHFGESTSQLRATTVVSDLSTSVFAAEAAMKLLAYGSAYFEDRWNQFDFVVVVGTLVGTIVQAIASSSVWSLTMVVRLIRVARIFRLVESSSSIRAILSTLYISLPGLSNITSILFLILFVYSTMGVHLFAKVAMTSNIDAHANFQSFGRGFLFLLRAATGESWDHSMYDLAASSPGCVSDPPYDPRMCGFSDAEDCVPLSGCGNPVAYIFFCSFTLIVAYVMLNLTVAVVLESFATSQEEEEESILVPELLEGFQYKWAALDPTATGFIRVDKMLPLVHAVMPPLGWFGIPMTMSHFFRYMRALQLPLYEGEVVHFRDVILAMTREMINVINNWTLDEEPLSDINKKRVGGASSRRFTGFYGHEYFAAIYLQRRVSNWLARQRQPKTKESARKLKRSTKRLRKLKKKHSGNLVLAAFVHDERVRVEG
ncbi:hypothetical protein PHYSODRAFT_337659 [Phytophthora sojae]|uniref:Voltage-gated Ion Channel (VIC) Superfamily n=2 Tax=Phytophthora TaxID=4783 RepID=G5A1T7_PHYSP|nr:hypothetical protein PHYSODRAFT_337659 [Phytophthora sojae]EGZ10885.1 hypothetical protein PHYSODRAFT_337659 [Phytophthora sojae]|eukprot:XP_009533630.1 hypothetical protein PHYSODRAFT_337659 [Phytophthora sojae]